ncbi:hypothetical protein [Azotobacter armeniacus]
MDRKSVHAGTTRRTNRNSYPREGRIINTLSQTLIACGLLLGLCQSSAAEEEDSYLYCGKLLWPAEREDYLPFPEGIEIGYSSHPVLAQIVEQQEKHSLRLTYEDMAITYRIMQEAVEVIIRQGSNEVCLQAGTVEASNSGLPLAISPVPTADGRVIFEPAQEPDDK